MIRLLFGRTQMWEVNAASYFRHVHKAVDGGNICSIH